LTELATNEELRNTLANKSLERSKVFSWDIAAEKIWNVLISQAK